MSSTNRSKTRDTHKFDYYITPVNVITSFFDKLKDTPELSELYCMFEKENTNILDPCAGGDKGTPMSYPTALYASFGINSVISCDIRTDAKAMYLSDYLSFDTRDTYEVGRDGFDVIITNPPFNIAQKVIEKAISDVNEEGYVIMLLRLNFFGSKKRKDFWKSNMPIATFVHTDRISFTEDGGTDSIEYMHCIWKKNVNPTKTELFLI